MSLTGLLTLTLEPESSSEPLISENPFPRSEPSIHGLISATSEEVEPDGGISSVVQTDGAQSRQESKTPLNLVIQEFDQAIMDMTAGAVARNYLSPVPY